MKKIIFIAGVVGFSANAIAQDIRKQASADIVKIREAYSRMESVSMNVSYKFFPEYDSKTPLEKHTGYYCKQGASNYYMELYGTTTVSNNEVVMVKNDSAKVFMLKKYYPEDTPQLTHEQFEKLLSVCSSVDRVQGKDGSVSGYRLLFKGKIDGMSKVEFFFNTQSYFINKMVLYYDRPVIKQQFEGSEVEDYPKPKLEVEYVNVNNSPVFDKKQFSVSKYLRKEKNGWQLNAPYASSFEFYDQTKTSLK